MPFPESPRVIYGKNPLEEVVCQLRFPPVLRIETEAPATFQERIRAAFPLYRRTTTQTQINLPAGLPQQLLQMIAGAGAAAHEFLSADEVWRVSLTREFLALTTSKYVSWDDFRGRFAEPLAALTSIYTPAFFQRIGLRYRDRVNREALGLSDVSWKALLKPHILGELADDRVGPNVVHALRELIVALADGGGRVRIVHGLDDDGRTYVIDADFFTEAQTAIDGAPDVLNEFNRRAGRLFRWCTSDRLHDAMEPRAG